VLRCVLNGPQTHCGPIPGVEPKTGPLTPWNPRGCWARAPSRALPRSHVESAVHIGAMGSTWLYAVDPSDSCADRVLNANPNCSGPTMPRVNTTSSDRPSVLLMLASGSNGSQPAPACSHTTT
jgi:hypothetical protein